MEIAPADLDTGGKALSSSSVVPVPESEPSPLELLSRRRVGSVEVCRSGGAFLRNGLRITTGMIVASGGNLCRGKREDGRLFGLEKSGIRWGRARSSSWNGSFVVGRKKVGSCGEVSDGCRIERCGGADVQHDRILGKRPVPNVTGRCDEMRRQN